MFASSSTRTSSMSRVPSWQICSTKVSRFGASTRSRCVISAVSGTDWSDGLKEAPVQFLSDEKDLRVCEQLAELVAGAKHSVLIESPYLIPSKEFLDLLASKVRSGVWVTIVTNSLRSSDGVLAQV